YLENLPGPKSIGGIFKLDHNQVLQLVPLVATTSVVVYALVKCFMPKKDEMVNLEKDKHEEKVADFVEIEDIGDKAVFCRCWRSKKFPYCDGSHGAHNKETGDNVGPLIVHKKKQ
ncbi:predicted protein, partial [Nematostella vectensis]